MRRKTAATIATILLVGLLLASAVGMASAHFTMIFPGTMEPKAEDYIASQGETKTIWIVWGHPYECIILDFPVEPEMHVRKPDGTVEKLTLSEITVQGKKAYKTSFIVDQMGDSIVYVKVEAEEHDLIDYTKAVIHSGEEVWEGWDAEVGQEAEVIPYMRPYGMEESFVFSGKALYNGELLPDATVEVEKYNPKETADKLVEEVKEKYSQDPPMIFTRVTKTNEAGDFIYSLDEPGIWFVGATKEVEDGLDKRGVFIIPVLAAFPAKEVPTIEEIKSRVESLEDKVATLETPAGEEAPGFGALTAIVGLLIVVYLVKRRKR